MTLFRYETPDFIFNHIHKSAGTSIRESTTARLMDQVDGFFPETWRDVYSFCVVRHPIDRFFSAINMFKFGSESLINTNDFYKEARFSELTVSRALDILMDYDIPFDRSVRNVNANLKHHLLPQTHPYRCVGETKEIFRYETFSEDMDIVRERIGLPMDIARVRTAKIGVPKLSIEDLTAQELEELIDIYGDDLYLLNYSTPTLGKLKSFGGELFVRKSDGEDKHISPWAYLHGQKASDALEHCLPPEDVDLRQLALQLVDGTGARTWAGRDKTLAMHFLKLEPEFAERSRLSHLIACCIVCIRRDILKDRAVHLFFRIMNEHSEFITKDLNTRWLASITDTYVDISDSAVERAVALSGSVTAALVKIAETERLLFSPNLDAAPKVKFRKGGELFDGVLSFWIESGDMIDNLVGRVDIVTSDNTPISLIVREIFTRISTYNTFFQRAISAAFRAPPSLISSDRLALLESRIAKLIAEARQK